MKYFDQHTHCCYSFDSKESIQNYINKAKACGNDTIVLTDHIDLDAAHYKDWQADLDGEQKEIVELCKSNPGFNILQGVEIGYCPEQFNYIKNLIKTHKYLNVVNLSMHWANGVDFYLIEQFDKFGVKETLKMYFLSTIQMITDFNDYDVLCHIDYAFATVKMNDSSINIKEYETYIIDIMKIIIINNKALEINTKCQSEINDDEHLKYLLKLYKSLGGKNITLSSDAHEAKRLYDKFDHCISIIKECGFEYLTVFIKRKSFKISI